MAANFDIRQDFIAEQNKAKRDWLAEDLEYLENNCVAAISRSKL